MEAENKKLTGRQIALIIALVVAAAALATVLYFRFFSDLSSVKTPENGGTMDAAVLYSGSAGTEYYKDTLSLLEQSTVPNLTVTAIDVDGAYSLDGLELLYPDHSMTQSANADKAKKDVTDFANGGGGVFLTNDFYDFFDKSFIGASDFVKLEYVPAGMSYPEAGDDLKETQDVLTAFMSLFNSYTDVASLGGGDYGYGIIAEEKVTSIAVAGDTTLYSVNGYGSGYVMFTNPLLPNVYSINGADMTARDESQTSFANTTNSANRLLYDAFARYVSKQTYGYALTGVYGSFGSPNMAWELHFEDINAIANNGMELFGELAKENKQIPSFSLTRNAYTWLSHFETVTYLVGQGSDSFKADEYEGAYSDGTHIAANGAWLSLASVEDGGSYFEDYPELTQTAYQWVGDLNGDELPDVVAGSSDGTVYFYPGQGYKGKYIVGEKSALTTEEGAPIAVESDAAPVAADCNGDGKTDLVIGSAQGAVYISYGTGKNNTFTAPELLIQTSIAGRTFPEVADFEGDGRPDLIVGSNEGKLIEYVGGDAEDLNVSDANAADLSVSVAELGSWIAPRMYDVDGDGVNELVIGTFDGYVARAKVTGGAVGTFEYYSGSETNLKGNTNLKFGNNAVPCFADINADSIPDLIVGSLEYGLAYPIDSEYFPYASELQSQIDYLEENSFFLEPHFFTNVKASSAWETQELAYQAKAMEKYGYDMNGVFGTNQHTWHLSWLTPTQTMEDLYAAGYKWNSGFEPVNSSIMPQTAAENVLSLPFYLTKDGQETLLIQNCSTVPYDTGEWTALSAKFDVPVLCYYHCDLMWKDDTEAKEYVAKVGQFQSDNGYNFVTEAQMMKASAAALHLTVSAAKTEGGSGFDVTLTPGQSAEDYSLYDSAYAASCGYKISLGEKLADKTVATDAKVWYRDGSDLYVSGDAPIRIFGVGENEAEKTHLERVNIAAVITLTDTGAEIAFKDDGMMQIVVSGSADADAEGWDVVTENGKTVFTKFGKAETITINY